MSEFFFRGGIRKPDLHTSEKFLLFFVIDGKEIPHFQLLRDGIIMRKTDRGDDFYSGLKVGKLFLGQQGFNLRRRFHSFYFYFLDEPSADIITIKPFSGDESGFYFKGPIRFLKKAEVDKLLDDESLSKKFLERQEPLPLDLLRSILFKESPKLKNIRFVRIGRKDKKPEDAI